MTEPNAEYCFACGQPATAAWRGDHAMGVCSLCAVEILPKLIGDAVDLNHTRPAEIMKRIVLQIQSNFWRAVTLRLLKRNT
jgi:hypothetical protein